MPLADTPAVRSATVRPARWLCSWLALLLLAVPAAQAQFTHQRTSAGATLTRPGDAPRCLTMEYERERRAANPKLPSLDEWETALQQRIQQAKVSGALAGSDSVVYQIPTVVHIAHAGEPVGQGRNLSYAQVQSQIEVMNEDFRKMIGTRGYNDDPVGADVRIEFVLAQRAPSGGATNGINRVDGTQLPGGAAAWSAYGSLNDVLKPQTIWPREDYFNIWVVEFTSPLLGIAQFPDASGLPGMPSDGGSANTDGFAVNYLAFGSIDKEPPGEDFDLYQQYPYGRTATHEAGHSLGLRHSWGDGGCGVDDYCGDTPAASNDSHDLGVGFAPACNTIVDCGSENMIENYMDYSDDACMNIFTLDQRARARTVMMNSPGRVTLPNSPALEEPVANDVGLARIVSPQGFLCTPGAVTPEIELINGGADSLTSATITYGLDSLPGSDQAYSWTGMLSSGETEIVALPALSVGSGSYTLEVAVSSPNGVADSLAQNNEATQSFSTEKQPLPYAQSFETGLPEGWARTPGTGSYRWAVSDDAEIVDPDGQTSTNVAFVDNYNNDNRGEEAVLRAEAVDLEDATTLSLSFDMAYARYSAEYSETLRVEVSTDCGQTFTEVYNESGSQLATVPDQNSYWTPASADDWRTEMLDLTDLIGGAVGDSTQGVQVRFVNVNGWGNNLFLDNVKLEGEVLPVELARFTSSTDDGDVLLNWETLSETGNDGFEVHRKMNGSFQKIGYQPTRAENGTSTEALSYRFRVEGLEAGTHQFRLIQVDRDGTTTPSNVVEATVGVEGAFELTEAYPNPTPGRATFGVALRQTQEVSVEVYNTLGQRIQTLHEGPLEGGSTHHFTVDGGVLASGLYLYRVVGEDFSGSGQVTVVR